MANQIRSGGTQKTTTPVYSENGVRNADRVIENIYGLATNERLFEDGSIPADKIVGGGGGAEQIVFLSGRSLFSIEEPALNTWVDYPLSSFSPPLPDCSGVLCSVATLSEGVGTFIMNAGFLDNTIGNIIPIANQSFTAGGACTTGVLIIPTIGDSVRLQFNSDLEIWDVSLYVIGYVL